MARLQIANEEILDREATQAIPQPNRLPSPLDAELETY